jgi:peptide/nickel transport system permease protein
MTAAQGPVEPIDRSVANQEPLEEGTRWALLRALLDSPVTIFAVVILVVVLIMAIAGEAIAPYGVNEINVMGIAAGRIVIGRSHRAVEPRAEGIEVFGD